MTIATATFGYPQLSSALAVLMTGVIGWAGQTLMETHDMVIRHDERLSLQGNATPPHPGAVSQHAWMTATEREERQYRQLLMDLMSMQSTLNQEIAP